MLVSRFQNGVSCVGVGVGFKVWFGPRFLDRLSPGPPTLKLAKVGLAKVGQHSKTLKLATVGQLELAKVGLAKVGRITMAKVGLTKVGFDQQLHGHRDILPLGFSTGTFFWDFVHSSLLHERSRRRIRLCHFCTFNCDGNYNCLLQKSARWLPFANNLQEFVHAVLSPNC